MPPLSTIPTAAMTGSPTADSSWLDASVRPSPKVLFQHVGRTAILLDLGSERYFELNEVGAALWRRLQAGESLRASYQGLLADYAVAPEPLAADLAELLGQLLAKGLLLRD